MGRGISITMIFKAQSLNYVEGIGLSLIHI